MILTLVVDDLLAPSETLGQPMKINSCQERPLAVKGRSAQNINSNCVTDLNTAHLTVKSKKKN